MRRHKIDIHCQTKWWKSDIPPLDSNIDIHNAEIRIVEYSGHLIAVHFSVQGPS